jgi:hypothetical protein
MSFVGKPMHMVANLRCRYGTSEMPARSVEARISAFLDGRTDGGDLLHALCDHVLHEPMPASMRAILETQQAAGR